MLHCHVAPYLHIPIFITFQRHTADKTVSFMYMAFEREVAIPVPSFPPLYYCAYSVQRPTYFSCLFHHLNSWFLLHSVVDRCSHFLHIAPRQDPRTNDFAVDEHKRLVIVGKIRLKRIRADFAIYVGAFRRTEQEL